MEVSRLSLPISDKHFFSPSIRHSSAHPLPTLPRFFALSICKSRCRSLRRKSYCSASNRDTLLAGGDEAAVVSSGKKEEEQGDLKSWMHKHGLPPCKVVLKERPSHNDTHKPIHYVTASEDLQVHSFSLFFNIFFFGYFWIFVTVSVVGFVKLAFLSLCFISCRLVMLRSPFQIRWLSR